MKLRKKLVVCIFSEHTAPPCMGKTGIARPRMASRGVSVRESRREIIQLRNVRFRMQLHEDCLAHLSSKSMSVIRSFKKTGFYYFKKFTFYEELIVQK